MAQGYASAPGRSFSAAVLGRILSVLHKEGATKKTNLAGKTRLNYLTCMKYLKLLKSLGLIELTKSDKEGDTSERVSISEPGRRFNSSLSVYLQGNGSSSGNIIATESQYYDIDSNKDLQELLEQIGPVDNNVPRNSHSKIMLVDDEQDILYTYKLFLSQRGYDADAFSNPIEALRQISLSPSSYELVITDIRMSSLNGLQLYRGIRALNPNIKIILISALDATDELVSVLPGLNKDFVLRKPVNREVFMKTVDLAFQKDGGNTANSISPLVRS